MAKQLTQKDKNGNAYYRPPEVEANIDGAIGQALDVIRRRLYVVKTSDLDYLTSECIVHLLRRAIEACDTAREALLYEFLLRRVEHIVLYRTTSRGRGQANEIALEVNYELNLLIAARSERLDFYEARFHFGIRNLYVQRLRAHDEPPTITYEEQVEDPRQAHSMSEASDRSTDLGAALNSLPASKRKAYLLVAESGYEIESKDPRKETAATLCGVSGRTIRTWLKEAKTKLAALLKDDYS